MPSPPPRQFFSYGNVHGLVNKDINTAGQFRNGFEWNCVTAEGNGTVREVESITERRVHWWMLNRNATYFHVLVLCHGAIFRYFRALDHFEWRTFEVFRPEVNCGFH